MGSELSKAQNQLLSESRQKSDDLLRAAYVRKAKGDFSPMSLEALAGIRLIRTVHDGDLLTDMLRVGKLRISCAWVLYFYYLMYWSHKNKFLWREVLTHPHCIVMDTSESHKHHHIGHGVAIKAMQERAKTAPPDDQWVIQGVIKDRVADFDRMCDELVRQLIRDETPTWLWNLAEACRFTVAETNAFWRERDRYSSPAQRRKRAFMDRAPLV